MTGSTLERSSVRIFYKVEARKVKEQHIIFRSTKIFKFIFTKIIQQWHKITSLVGQCIYVQFFGVSVAV